MQTAWDILECFFEEIGIRLMIISDFCSFATASSLCDLVASSQTLKYHPMDESHDRTTTIWRNKWGSRHRSARFSSCKKTSKNVQIANDSMKILFDFKEKNQIHSNRPDLC